MLAFVGNSHISQFNLPPTIVEIYALGASIKGLVNPESQLKFKESINIFITNNPLHSLVFFLGQVDIEFGYYYKCVKDNIKYNINDYCDDLIQRYESYLKTLTCNFYVLSINPTVIIDNVSHVFKVCFREDYGKNGYYSEENYSYNLDDNVKKILNDSYETRFLHNKLFNQKLEQMCLQNGFKYIDFWNIVTENNQVIEKYRPLHNDHHLRRIDNTDLLKYIIYKISSF